MYAFFAQRQNDKDIKISVKTTIAAFSIMLKIVTFLTLMGIQLIPDSVLLDVAEPLTIISDLPD